MFFAVYLKCKKFVVVKREWILNPVVREESLVFLSQNNDVVPNFQLEKGFYISKNVEMCYEGFIFKSFKSQKEAEKYVEQKRIAPPVQYKSCKVFDFDRSVPQVFVDLSDSSESESDETQQNSMNGARSAAVAVSDQLNVSSAVANISSGSVEYNVSFDLTFNVL